MILHAANLECGHPIIPRDAAHVRPNAFLNVGMYEGLTTFGRKNKMEEKIRVCVRHGAGWYHEHGQGFQLSRRDTSLVARDRGFPVRGFHPPWVYPRLKSGYRYAINGIVSTLSIYQHSHSRCARGGKLMVKGEKFGSEKLALL